MTNMSDLARAAPPVRVSLAALAGPIGFASDPRFSGAASPAPPPPDPAAAPADPLAVAWAEGYATGVEEARTEARLLAEADEAARGRIELSLARLDEELAEALRQKLYATVESLCEAAIAPLMLDKAALAARVERAAGMLARADDERVLRLHPDDLKLVGKRLPEGLDVVPDPALERGALRVETANGGVEDGPAHWRAAIAEALGQC
ncbi:FliH/SctL family protein [Novosphingobium sp.]|uniref:FliH/SctL family protein n=1 Tax=Novosphingobium sp. TaxID=1874826 RepID=UPI0035B03CCC